MKKDYIILVMLISLLGLVTIVGAWTPPDSINQRDLYNITNWLDMNGSGNITTTGNITADYFYGNGSQLTDIVWFYYYRRVATNDFFRD